MVYLAVARRQDEGGETALGKGQSYGRAIEDGICGLVRDVKDLKRLFGVPVVQCEVAARAGNIPQEASLAVL